MLNGESGCCFNTPAELDALLAAAPLGIWLAEALCGPQECGHMANHIRERLRQHVARHLTELNTRPQASKGKPS